MAGIYIHIPFCRQKCYYCDFYKTVNTSLLGRYLQALKTEMQLRADYLGGETVETLYFGGGTPSVLSEQDLSEIISFVRSHFLISSGLEITLEANPDDLTTSYLQQVYNAGVRRLSIGIQSFQDELLKKMNRRHDSGQAVEAIENAVSTGFNDISVDFIYGLPGLTNRQWKADLQKVFSLPVTHLSAYHLTYHEGTPFNTWLKKGTLKQLTETESISQFETLVEMARENGFEHYEISNFARNGMYSKHNTSYWTGKKYLGLGPSAHSFNGVSRRWNVSHAEKYIKATTLNEAFSEEEILTDANRYNEYVLTRIRTMWGVSVSEIQNQYGEEKAVYFQENIKKYLRSGLAVQTGETFTLTPKGWFVSDEISTSLMFV
ncbi:MAG TPA: coproporphyrinogen III oxidase [Prolixibacteraceae bacterium]|nr:coproporphyrinogen III oxidase [Prolixibacteraceae bacterium]